MKQQFEALKTRLDKQNHLLEFREKQAKDLELKISNLKKELIVFEDANSLAKKCLEGALAHKTYIEEVISSGLSEVFDSKFVFILEPVIDNGISKGLKPRIKEGNGEFDDRLQSFGASSAAICSVCFRICLLLLSSGTEKVLIMDEPLANISPKLQNRFRAFIEAICSKTGLQLVMVTHLDEPFGTVYEIKKNEYSYASVVKEQE